MNTLIKLINELGIARGTAELMLHAPLLPMHEALLSDATSFIEQAQETLGQILDPQES